MWNDIDLSNESAVANLPKGRLFSNLGYVIELTFNLETVLESAYLLVAHNDCRDIDSQASIVARAKKYDLTVPNTLYAVAD